MGKFEINNDTEEHGIKKACNNSHSHYSETMHTNLLVIWIENTM